MASSLPMHNLYKRIPGVDQILLHPLIQALDASHPRSLVLKAIHGVLDGLRADIQCGRLKEPAPELTMERICGQIMEVLSGLTRPSLRQVINATGVVVHTNLGRSILPEAALDRLRAIGGGYSNLEYDLDRARRGSRYVHAEEILRELTGAEGAMVVNNNAAAVLVSLDTLARGRQVVVSRGQLVEIGGSFRIPDVMRRSGALMKEVGTTNKTHLRDYEEAIGPETALLLKVHTSNFKVVGFTQEVPLQELAALGKKNGIPVMEDLGSGCFVDFSEYGLTREPTVQEALGQGADLVTFSGDKLLGGPQAGLILGRKDLVDAIRKNQLSRALRIDKLTLVALEETLRLYRDPRKALDEIPTLRMICQTPANLSAKAARVQAMIGPIGEENFSIRLVDGSSRVGGGALPVQDLPSRLLALVPKRLSAERLELKLRNHAPPIIARLEKDRVLLDVRTVQEDELKTVSEAIVALSQSTES